MKKADIVIGDVIVLNAGICARDYLPTVRRVRVLRAITPETPVSIPSRYWSRANSISRATDGFLVELLASAKGERDEASDWRTGERVLPANWKNLPDGDDYTVKIPKELRDCRVIGKKEILQAQTAATFDGWKKEQDERQAAADRAFARARKGTNAMKAHSKTLAALLAATKIATLRKARGDEALFNDTTYANGDGTAISVDSDEVCVTLEESALLRLIDLLERAEAEGLAADVDEAANAEAKKIDDAYEAGR
jgi:hypothetical protein